MQTLIGEGVDLKKRQNLWTVQESKKIKFTDNVIIKDKTNVIKLKERVR